MKNLFEKLKRASLSTVIAVLAAVLLCGAGIAWYIGKTEVPVYDIDGTIQLDYFHCGTGTVDDPFVITRPIHYYHLVELYQRLNGFKGYGSSANTQKYYFEIGYDLDGDPTTKEVFEYNDSGFATNRLSTTLNMNYYSGERALLPIGTSEIPFDSSLIGNGITVDNLHIKASEWVNDGSVTGTTYGTCDIGIFGYLGPSSTQTEGQGDDATVNTFPCVKDVYFDHVTIDLTGLDTSTISVVSGENSINLDDNGHSDNAHILTSETVAYVGYIAGHITEGAVCEDVYVNNVKIVGGSAAKCNFGYFGCVELRDGSQANSLGGLVATLRTAGDDAGFGGTINMKTTYDRLDHIFYNATQDGYYISSETVLVHEETDPDETIVLTTSASPSLLNPDNPHTTALASFVYNNTTYNYKYYDTHGTGGVFNLPGDNGEDTASNATIKNWYMCLFGETTRFPKTVHTYTFTNTNASALRISDGGYYLGAHDYFDNVNNGTVRVAAVSDSADALNWIMDNSGHLYAYVYDAAGNDKNGDSYQAAKILYLNRSGKASVTLGTTATTVWTRGVYDSEADPQTEALYTDISGTSYYLVCIDGVWILTPVASYYVISASSSGEANWSEPSRNRSRGAAAPKGIIARTVIEEAPLDTSKGFDIKIGTDDKKDPLNDADDPYVIDADNAYVIDADVKIIDTPIKDDSKKKGDSQKIDDPYHIGMDVEIRNIFNDAGNGTPVYLSCTTSALTVVSDANDAVQWQLSNPTGAMTQIYAYFGDNDVYYLGNSGTSLTISTSPTAWARTVNAQTQEISYYVTVNDVPYMLVYDASAGNWGLAPASGWRIENTVSGGHFLSADGSGIFDSATGSLWQFTANSGDTAIFTIVNGSKQYLAVANDALTLSGSAVTWHRSGASYYTTVGSTDYYLCYDNGWYVIPTAYNVIHNGDDYLTVDQSSNDVILNTHSDTPGAIPDAASHFYFSVNGANPSGVVYTLVGGTPYYLVNNSGTLTVTTNRSQATSWTNDGQSLYSGNYAIRFRDSVWNLQNIESGYLITDGDGNYLRITGTGTYDYTNTTNPEFATRFTFPNNNKISTVVNGTTLYLSRDGNYTLILTTNSAGDAAGWNSNPNNTITCLVNDTYRFLIFDGTWRLNYGNTAYKGYTIKTSSGGNYLNADPNASANGLWSSTDPSTATVWANSTANGQSGYYSTSINGQVYYLRKNNSTLTIELSTTNDTYDDWTNNNNRLRMLTGTNRTILYDNGWGPTVGTNNNGTILSIDYVCSFATTISPYTPPRANVYVDSAAITAPTVSPVAYTTSENLTQTFETVDRSLTFEEMQQQVINYSSQSGVRSGIPTYFPIRVDKDDQGNYPAGYAASNKNTGYIVSGANISTGGNQQNWGDIRISGFSITDYISGGSGNAYRAANGSYDPSYNNSANSSLEEGETAITGEIRTLYTVNGSGIHVMNQSNPQSTEASVFDNEAFKNAKKALERTLQNQQRVFGLHFMDATIDIHHLITAEKANIFGRVYENYQLPEDSIDFNVVERGYISFFAGAYFEGSGGDASTRNNTFFSLHQIIRDPSSHDILAILEISKIYELTNHTARDNYLYEFKTAYNGCTFYDGRSWYASRPAGYTREVFDTRWITDPNAFAVSGDTNTQSIYGNGNNIYFFQIPCNIGEYALGSVATVTPISATNNQSAGIGAYLIYLDIATNGGDIMNSVLDPEVNDVGNAFKVEFRDSPDTVNHSLLMFSIDAPEVPTQNVAEANRNFSVETSYTSFAGNQYPQSEPDAQENYPNGIYTIKVVNKSDTDLQLTVWLCDDDDDRMNNFPYAYRILYVNADHTTETPVTRLLTTTESLDYWQSVATFTIPATGDAAEFLKSDYSAFLTN